MHITYVSFFDAKDIHSWSGAGYHIAKALEDQGAELDYIGQLSKRVGIPLKIQLGLKEKYYKMLGKNFNSQRSIAVATKYAEVIKTHVKPYTDILFSPGSVPLSLLETKKKKVFYTDATFAGISEFYKEYSNLCSETERAAHYLQKQILDSCSLAIYTSDWAAKTAIEYYGANPERVKVVPFGANIEDKRTLDLVKDMIKLRSSKECHLTFLGVDWERKGGDIALETVKLLNERGLKAFLHVAGIKKMPLNPLPSYIIDHGFISKSTEEGRRQFDKLMESTHFLLLPTRAEAFGLVFCEANSYGIPNVATNVGGIPTIIKDGVNGQKFNLFDTADRYADYIQSVFSNQNFYNELALSSFGEYEARLNWRVSGKKLMTLLKDI
ncbi:MAG: glycosyltransferase family 4 protein [Agriterribacter sp.]